MARCGLDSHRALEVCVFGIGEGELAIIVVFGFLLFGPDKLPQMGRTIGRAIRQFRETQEKMTAVVQSEIIDPVSEAASAPVKPKKTAVDDDSDADEDAAETAVPAKKETFAERDPLAAEEPTVLESSADDPEFPAMQEFEVDEGGPKANTRKHPGLIWAIIAIVAVIALCIAFAAAGDWMNPTQAEKVQQTEFEEQTVPEDLGPNENPEAA